MNVLSRSIFTLCHPIERLGQIGDTSRAKPSAPQLNAAKKLNVTAFIGTLGPPAIWQLFNATKVIL